MTDQINNNEVNIPNAVTTAQLQQALHENQTHQEEALINGMTRDQLVDFVSAHGLDLSQFGNDAPNVEKLQAVLGLMRLARWHNEAAMRYETAGKYDQAADWRADYRQLMQASRLVMNVWLGEKDGFFAELAPNEFYPVELSADSREVLDHFGIEAPVILNRYACALEDALMEQINKTRELEQKLADLQGADYVPTDYDSKLQGIKRNYLPSKGK